MPRKGYDWEIGNTPPIIEAHSLAKHEVLREYLSNYIQILCQRPVIENLNLTLVDGFAGGGTYTHYKTGKIISGSPLILLNAIKESEELVNFQRSDQGIRNRLSINAQYYFIEKDAENFKYLETILTASEYQSIIGSNIKLIHGTFDDNLEKIIRQTKSMHHSQRCIFILDQYGYSDVSFTKIRSIFDNYKNAEVILTFATDSLINFISENNYDLYKSKIENLGLSDELSIDQLIDEKEANPAWRYVIESQLVEAIKKCSGANHFTPFYIVSRKSNRAYWLVHLSMHPRAQDEMTRLHWELNNHFQHYGKPGLNMLGYDPANDVSIKDQFSLDFMFDNNARKLTHDALLKDIPEFLHSYKDGLPFSKFFAITCNETPADDKLYKEVLNQLLQAKEVDITGESGELRRSGYALKNKDIIRLSQQKKLIFL